MADDNENNHDNPESTQQSGMSAEDAMVRAMEQEHQQSMGTMESGDESDYLESSLLDDFDLDDIVNDGTPMMEAADAESMVKGISSSDVNLETLLKVPVSLSIEVGRTRMPISQLLETNEGTVIELERLLEEPLDILVNGALIAHGVVVLANERFGIQITDIVSPQERVRSI